MGRVYLNVILLIPKFMAYLGISQIGVTICETVGETSVIKGKEESKRETNSSEWVLIRGSVEWLSIVNENIGYNI